MSKGWTLTEGLRGLVVSGFTMEYLEGDTGSTLRESQEVLIKQQ